LISIKDVNSSTISLVGSVSHHEANQVQSDLERRIKQSAQQSLDIDLSALESVSSVVLSLLLCGLRAASSVSCTARYVNMPQGLFNMARVGGIESILVSSEV